MLNYSQTKLWKDAMELYRSSSPIFKMLKDSKYFRLSEQMESSCGSVSDNIAEGFGRGGNRELIQFLAIARGSCAEFESQLSRVHIIGLIPQSKKEALCKKTHSIQRQISHFITYLNESELKGAKFKR